jgi:hypothetical protein
MISLAITTIAAILTGICVYQFAFKDHGPLHISKSRFEEACLHLHESGDAGQKPLTLLAVCTLVSIMALDGFLTGTALTTSVFAQWLSPRGALYAAFAWSVGCTYLLFKLVVASAHESVVNERRAAIRVLSQGNEAQHAKAETMKARVGAALGHDYNLDANRKGARTALMVTVLVLMAATFAMRTANGNAEAGATAPTAPAAPMMAPMPTHPTTTPALHTSV